MRLSLQYINEIKQAANDIWGNHTSVILFGSRIDDTKKGGDIDLLIQTDKNLDTKNIVRNKIKFLSRLDVRLGEQKIDLIVLSEKNQHLGIIKTALSTGIKL